MEVIEGGHSAPIESMRTRRGTPAGGRAFETFSQIHLATAAEQAVYRCFVREPDSCWSDAEIALVSRSDIAAIRWALERFATAGLIEGVEEDCYRWRAELRYALERTQPESEGYDPVCGMPVPADAPLRAEDALGRIERFCCERCLAAFLLWPLAFTRPPDATADGPPEEDGRGS